VGQIIGEVGTCLGEGLSAANQIPTGAIAEQIKPEGEDGEGDVLGGEEQPIETWQEEEADPGEGQQAGEVQGGIVGERVEEEDGVVPERMAIDLNMGHI
jgi:hypothetical protein